MKKILFLLAACITLFTSCENLFDGKPKTLSLFDFIRDNPGRSSFIMTANDTVVVNLNADKNTMLGSNTHLIVALEYAKQMSEGSITGEDTMVALADIEVFNINKQIDPGHFNWQKHLESNKLVKGNRVPLEEVVRGMLRFNSMAITEYLSDKLGFVNINIMKIVLGIKSTEPVYLFPVSSYLLFSTYKDSTINLPKQTTAISKDLYFQQSNMIHQSLKRGMTESLRTAFASSPPKVDQKLLEKWETLGTAGEFHSIIRKINSNYGLSETARKRMERLMDWSVVDHKIYYEHIGKEIGITSEDITGVIYATDANGYRTEIVCFLNDLTFEERVELSGIMEGFLMNCTNKKNRQNIIDKLKNN